MKRQARTILIFLLLGAIINVAVAWMAPITMSITSSSIGLNEGEDDVLQDAYQSAWIRSMKSDRGLHVYATSGEWNAFTTIITFDAQDTIVPDPFPYVGIQVLRAGWPLRACEGRRIAYLTSTDNTGNIIRVETFMAIPLSSQRIYTNDAGIIPFGPLWPGFFANIVFYATVIWLLRMGVIVPRRFLRLRRGLCPDCAYDLRGAPPVSMQCPECGRRLASGETA